MSTSPFKLAAVEYLEAGWSPIPLPEKAKWPPPDGFTGAQGKFVDKAQLGEWKKGRAAAGKMRFAPGNIALRLPDGVIGIDADMYDDKAGRSTLASAEEAWGQLPPTWMATSRADGSGIRLFRVPLGLAWPESLSHFFGGGVELIRWDHRYVVCMPSIHDKTGEQYIWQHPEGHFVNDEFPAPEELTDLPTGWVEGLTQGARWKLREVDELDSDDVRAWIEARPADGICSAMRGTLTKWSRLLREAGDDGGAHDEARDGAWALIGDAAAGHSGVSEALVKLRKVFFAAVKGRRGKNQAADEWARIVIRGVQKLSAEGEPDDEDMCAMLSGKGAASPSSGSGKKAKARGSSTYDYTRDDAGNAQRLINKCGEDIRYVEGLGGWQIWDGSRWRLDDDGQIERWAIEMVRDMAHEAEFIEEPKAKAAFIAFIRSSSNVGKLRAMMDLAQVMKGITIPVKRFNQDPNLLVCANGTIELGETCATFRPSRREDYCTSSTEVAYDPLARSDLKRCDLWDKFLLKFLPDDEVRLWIQKLVGYSLMGANPQRFMIAAFGDTSTGKSTFFEAIRAALGDYCSAINATIFRDNQDERPRADLVEVLPQRVVYAEEMSEQWHLHADQIKRLTGGVQIKARLPYAKDYVKTVPCFTPWLLTNNPPTIEGADMALLRRLLVVPFDVVIGRAEEVSDFTARLLKVSPEAILAWAVEGYNAWKRDGDDLWVTPLGAVEATLKFRSELSDLDLALDEMCEFDAEHVEKPSALFEAYERWCDLNGITASKGRLTGTRFGRQLNGKGFKRKSVRVSGDPQYMRVGLRLKAGWKAMTTQ